MKPGGGSLRLAGRLLTTGILIAMLPLILAAARGEQAAALSPNRWSGLQVDRAIAETKDPAQLTERARAMATARPLDPAAYFLAAAAAGSAGDEARSLALLRETARRRMSFAPAHAWLAGYYFRAGQNKNAIAQADLAMRVDGSMRKALIPLLVPQLGTLEGSRALMRALDHSPLWRVDFLTAAIQQRAAPDALFAILSSAPAGTNEVSLREHRAMFIGSLVAANDAERAYLAWISFLPDDAVGKVSTVYDGNFQKLPGSPPFNWVLSSAAGGYADYGSDKADGLAVRYSASITLALASQTLFLPKGQWRFAAQAKGTRSEWSGTLKWRVACLPGDREIGTMPLDRLGAEWREQAITVTVPADNCALQQITLLGFPGETTETVNAQIRGVRASRIDDRR
jgi:hypothetical protein